MNKKIYLSILLTILVLPFVSASDVISCEYTYIGMGNGASQYEYTLDAVNSPWTNPSFLSTTTGLGAGNCNSCTGPGCWSRYMVMNTNSGMNFQITNGTTKLADINLRGVLFTTIKDKTSCAFGGVAMLWGDATIDSINTDIFAPDGEYTVVLEYWNPSYTAFAIIDKNDDAIYQIGVNMTRILSNNEIILKNNTMPKLGASATPGAAPGIDYEVEADNWDLDFSNIYQTLSPNVPKYPDLHNHSVTIGTVTANNVTNNILINGWSKNWYNQSADNYRRVLYGCAYQKDTTGEVDDDKDGYAPPEDCNDNNPAINPDAEEVCDGVDNDCDTETDEGLLSTYYEDSDGDTYGNSGSSQEECSAPAGYVEDNTDCNDADTGINPGAAEICNSVDDDCDTEIDEGVKTMFYQDADSDTYGNSAVTEEACSASLGYVADNTDCDDTNIAIYTLLTGYADNDEDTYTVGAGQEFCTDGTVPTGYTETENGEDCNDVDPTINPGATETPYNGIDEDCSGADLTDVDNDGYDAEVAGGNDCDDSNENINPGIDELGNAEIQGDGVDDDCSGADFIIYGRVSDDLEQDIYHATVTAYCGADEYSALTGEGGVVGNGDYSIFVNTPGTCYSEATKAGFLTSGQHNFVAGIGGSDEYDFTLTADGTGSGGISGYVALTSPINPLPLAKVTIREDATGDIVQIIYSSAVAPIGKYNAVGLPPGTYDLEAELVGYTYPSANPSYPPAQDIVVSAGSTRNNINLWMDAELT